MFREKKSQLTAHLPSSASQVGSQIQMVLIGDWDQPGVDSVYSALNSRELRIPSLKKNEIDVKVDSMCAPTGDPDRAMK